MLGWMTPTCQMANCRFDDLITHKDNKKAMHLAKTWAEKFPEVRRGLLFAGPAGTGKTHMAAAMASEIQAKVYWATMPELIIELRPESKTQQAVRVADECYRKCCGECGPVRQGYKPERNCVYCPHFLRGKQPIIGNAADAPVLVLDDLGTNKPTDWVAEQIYNLLNQRIEYGLPVIGTTNYTLEQLETRLGHDRAVSRLVGLCAVVEVGGEDWRVKR